MNLTLVCLVNNWEVFDKNLGASKVNKNINTQTLIGEHFDNISKGYNQLAKKASEDIICFVHQDVFFPDRWEDDFYASLEEVNKINKEWGVLGVAGVDDKLVRRGWLDNRGDRWGHPRGLPAEIVTLDELILIVKNPLKHQFDEQFYAHFYGADLCMQYRISGNPCYAINAYLHHNHKGLGPRANGFRELAPIFRNKYSEFLPLATTCVIFR